ncbi:ankyrin repeat-containing protein [Malassezia sp. CBS 17886]|nr:ankyrin repeat-containing protein [Malassezia sp. CBS 17886]
MALAEAQVDDVLWAARAGDRDALETTFVEIGGERDAAARAALAAVSDTGNSALHLACANGHSEIVEMLLRAADLRALLRRNSAGNTPLHWAAFNGHVDIVEALIARLDACEREDAALAQTLRDEEDARERARHAAAAAQADEPTPDVAAERERHEEQQRERALWDVRNEAGRGPMSEAQMADREAVVQALLACLARADGADVVLKPVGEQGDDGGAQEPAENGDERAPAGAGTADGSNGAATQEPRRTDATENAA